MDLDRGTLARLDRKLLAGLGQDETYRMVRVPVTASKWATWKRYCDTAGISMGRAIVSLIDQEMVSTFGDRTDDHPPRSRRAGRGGAGQTPGAGRPPRGESGGCRETAPGVEPAAQQVGGRPRDPRAESRAHSEGICSAQRVDDQGRSQRTMPVRIRPQAQALPRPAWPGARSRSQITVR